ncbi:MAG: hypothetical protein LRS43_00985, partial [Desulfurococcales archaeon]|nr:hypothetical protein [Desulfurococcales archaeon]
MARSVTVSAPSHVHVGNIDLEGSLGRLFGTIGFTLNKPRFEVELTASSEPSIQGYERSDMPEIFTRLVESMSCSGRAVVTSEIPRGVGLGSTTAAVLSIGFGLKVLCDSNVGLEEIALAMGRSGVSALGFYSFRHGGFLIDGGFRGGPGRSIPPLLFRAPVPSNLVMVIALPQRPIRDVLKLKEREAEILEALSGASESTAMKLARIAVMGIMPSAAEGDWA